MGKREQWLDVCKGYLIILVVLGHVVTAFQSAGMFVGNLAFQYFHTFAYSLHMATFFFIAGYTHSHFGKREMPLGQKIRKRLLSYGVPYLLFSLVYYIVKIMMSGVVNSPIRFDEILFIGIKPFGFMWFLYALMLMELIQDCIDKYARGGKLGKTIHIVIAIAAFFAQVFFSKKYGAAFTDTIISDVMRMYIYFVTSIYFGESIVGRIKTFKAWGTLFLTLLLVVVNGLIVYKSEIKMPVVTLLLAFVGIVSAMSISLKTKKSGWLAYLGRISLTIYLLHDYVLVVWRVIAKMFGIENWIIIICVGLMAGVLLPVILYQLSSKLHLDFVFYPTRYIKIGEKGKHD